MNLTIGQFRDYLERFLEDSQITTIERVIDATNSALNALVAYEPKMASVQFVGDGSTASFPLPDDYYWYQGLFNGDGNRINILWPSNTDYLMPVGENIALITPSGNITFIPSLQTGEMITLYYYARWARVTSETDTIEPPYHWLAALTYYASAELIISDALTAAGVRQYNTRIDSGNPEQNPVQRQVESFRKMFREEVNRHARITIRNDG